MENKYKHGGNPLDDLLRLNLPERDIIDFSVNLNPLGMPEVISENWGDLINSVKDYPSIEGNGISDFYTKKTGVPESEFLSGNGSTELIYLIPRVLGFKRVLILTPSFHDYERASLMAGASVKKYSLSPENDFSMPSTEQLKIMLDDVDAMWIGRPNNPTAGLFSKNTILELASRHPNKYFIVDEAFIQFVDNWKEESLISNERYPNIIIVHSLTKFYAIAGLRMGGVIGHRDIINKLRESKEPWSVNGIAEKVAYLLMNCGDYEMDTINYIHNERKRIFKHLKKIDGIDPFPSCTNFFLCQWKKTGDLDDIIAHLLKNGIYVRDCRNFIGLEDNFFRFGIRSVEENNLLLSLLSSFSNA